MPKKLTIIGVLAALVLGIVGLTRQNAEAYTAQSYCTPSGASACTGGASPVDVILCYGGAAPTVLGTCGAGSSPNTITSGLGSAITNYTQIVIPPGSRLTLPVTFTPGTWGATSPTRCVNDESGNTCSGGLGATSRTGDVTSTTDLLCDGTYDVLAKPGIIAGVTGDWPGNMWAGQGFEYYRTFDTVSGPPSGGDPNAYVMNNAPWPTTFAFKSLDKSRLEDLYLGGTFDLNLVTLTGAATPLQLLAADSSYTSPNGMTLSAALLAGSPAPPTASYLCLQSPQNSVSSNTTLKVPAVAGYYPRWVDIQSDIDFVDGSVTRVVVVNCVTVGAPASPDTDGDCLSDADEVTAGTNAAVADTDGDGLPDGMEVANGSSPISADVDGDTVTDFTELFQFTNPNSNDTDGDLRLDKQNNLAGFSSAAPYYNPPAGTDNCPTKSNDTVGDLQLNTDSKPDHTLTPASAYTDVSNPHQDYQGDACDTDDDNDGINDESEGGFGLNSGASAPPLLGKGWCHLMGTAGLTLTLTTLDPLNPDVDGDGGLDGIECQFTSNPTSPLSRYPTALLGEDPDLDGLFAPSTAGSNAAAENLYHTGNISVGAATCPQVAVGACSGGLLNDIDGDTKIGTADADSDNDGLIDGAEVKFYGTAPSNADTDGDGCSDGREAGDINGDRKVTATDLQQVAARFGNIRTLGVVDPLKTNYDFNKDGNISASDLGGVAKVFGNCPLQSGKTPTNASVIVH